MAKPNADVRSLPHLPTIKFIDGSTLELEFNWAEVTELAATRDAKEAEAFAKTRAILAGKYFKIPAVSYKGKKIANDHYVRVHEAPLFPYVVTFNRDRYSASVSYRNTWPYVSTLPAMEISREEFENELYELLFDVERAGLPKEETTLEG